jgi:hypothetical protein
MPSLSKQHHYYLLIIILSVSCIYKINNSPKKIEDKKLKIKISPGKTQLELGCFKYIYKIYVHFIRTSGF